MVGWTLTLPTRAVLQTEIPGDVPLGKALEPLLLDDLDAEGGGEQRRIPQHVVPRHSGTPESLDTPQIGQITSAQLDALELGQVNVASRSSQRSKTTSSRDAS